ncbi:MAG: kynureninase [Gemmatimonadales bacterium]
MTVTPRSLHRSPNALASHYSRFRVAERLLLTGHSHQAWPDVGFDAQQQAWLDAAELVDEKWDRAFAMAERVRRGFARLLDDPDGVIALGPNTHELVVRWLSALPLVRRPHLVTTTAEFHTIRRQLDRLAEEGIEVVKIEAVPADTLAERLARAVDTRTAAVLMSAVLFENAHIVPALGQLADACRRAGAELLVDAYHALNVVPFSLRAEGLLGAFVTGGGYKYCQLGEGNCFLRAPRDCALRPVITGWFSEFDALARDASDSRVAYGAGPARFAGATYDPTSHYRAARVFDFFEQQGLTAALLRDVSRHQVGLLASLFDEADLDPAVISRDRSVSLDGIAGFLALRCTHAAELCVALRRRGVSADYRGAVLRLGPAPYLSDDQLRAAMAAVRNALLEDVL